jgi:hypothetical protein
VSELGAAADESTDSGGAKLFQDLRPEEESDSSDPGQWTEGAEGLTHQRAEVRAGWKLRLGR